MAVLVHDYMWSLTSLLKMYFMLLNIMTLIVVKVVHDTVPDEVHDYVHKLHTLKVYTVPSVHAVHKAAVLLSTQCFSQGWS